ncbi:DNA-binding transcriptional regulator FabR [Colwellia sp. PAMC 20917]|jgi:AcrR family transcriptional regulator|uniref:HTH-type transcriptional repressor FabR n=1 Tax=unclassified Colwellia TaxID=196834 RepID=UPI000878FCC3|nr:MULTISPECIES: HTH-type transcriptional repressor FabR [unclassified Colwellia]MBA6363317.1 HTH-type transcriptional repressor FabR [Colwellia sp. BRX8-8]AOW77521.1 DNA-binding transcriptional regulator FabR [Colwellia sp. PAMC 20917]MBA6336765.1 HTH-type transcriptional repressor FabR [Colwellia sp. BRX8-7]MBA6348429.1 HTH-type transcriptional repressor FabR [Colwellia sp. BRX8-9]MBA6352276.1 HTH-type transcriptional repressor FabR [Colwellia sp. BRX9-1]|tara:strand:+ start:1167 stop:1784 length:618 start_codon:yes stop_codon:yes gene_type:complete
MSGIRAQQKEKTRRQIIDAALGQLSSERSFSSLSLREVAKEAGLAPTSFYRHFSDMNELGLTLVDEAGLTLRQLMRQARQRIEKGGSVIQISVVTFMEFIESNGNIFRLLLRERSGTSAAFRAAVNREVRYFTLELCDYLQQANKLNADVAFLQADAAVTIVFSAGSDALDVDKEDRQQISMRTIQQLRFIARGAAEFSNRGVKK